MKTEKNCSNCAANETYEKDGKTYCAYCRTRRSEDKKPDKDVDAGASSTIVETFECDGNSFGNLENVKIHGNGNRVAGAVSCIIHGDGNSIGAAASCEIKGSGNFITRADNCTVRGDGHRIASGGNNKMIGSDNHRG